MREYFELAGRDMVSPLMNAAGAINGTNEEEILRRTVELSRSPVGAIVLGSFTVPRQEGNEATYGEPVYYHDPKTGATYNSMGLPNIGLHRASLLMEDLREAAHDKQKLLIVSVSPTVNTLENGDTFQQVKHLVDAIYDTNADQIEINTSCPNVVTDGGERKPILGYDIDGMEKLFAILRSLHIRGQAISIKLPPYISDYEKQVAKVIANLLIDNRDIIGSVVVSNTIPGQKPLDSQGEPVLSVPGGVGGMSGPATKEIGREQLIMWRTMLGDSMQIVSALGLDSGEEMARRMKYADAVSGVTFLWQSENWQSAVSNMVQGYVEAEEAQQ